jgi:hypothetical protein
MHRHTGSTLGHLFTLSSCVLKLRLYVGQATLCIGLGGYVAAYSHVQLCALPFERIVLAGFWCAHERRGRMLDRNFGAGYGEQGEHARKEVTNRQDRMVVRWTSPVDLCLEIDADEVARLQHYQSPTSALPTPSFLFGRRSNPSQLEPSSLPNDVPSLVPLRASYLSPKSNNEVLLI